MDILEGLNEQQRKAVQHGDGPLLLLAGAGSGKTKVLTHRVAYLIKVKGISPANILAVTFTNKAAEEMRNRLYDLVGPIESSQLWVSTFHSACVRFLRRDIEKLDMGYGRDFTIYDTTDQMILMKLVMSELNIDPKNISPGSILNFISRAKNDLKGPDEVLKTSRTYFEQQVARIYKQYQERLRENNALDFDDLIMLAVKLFETCPEVLDYYQEKFRYILIDEYQDTNHAQYVLSKLLAAKYRNICVIGDDDQAIYSWRGADIRNILEFEKDYEDVAIFCLEQNYRSTQTILDAAYHVVKNNMYRREKRLWTAKKGGNKIIYYKAEDEKDESMFVANTIARLYTDRKYDYNDFAVLYRMNAQSRALENVLRVARIPYTIIGGLRFYERAEIKDIIAYLRLILNKSDSISLERIINVPARNIGKNTIAKLKEFAYEQKISVYEAMRRADQIKGIQARSCEAVLKFVDMIEGIDPDRKPSLVIQDVLERTGYLKALQEENTIESQSRIENARELLSEAKDFENRTDGKITLREFLEGITLKSDIDKWNEFDKKVSLMTLHCAKGLEFPVVFMVGMDNGIFPLKNSFDSDDEMEEERRLCYVGITRAKDLLYFTSAERRMLFGTESYYSPSLFIDEIPSKYIQEHSSWESPVFNLQASESEPESDGFDFKVGDRVRHPLWGVGVITNTSGQGRGMIIGIRFLDGSKKTLVAEFAKLVKI